ncbi:Uncharacterized protein TPAR_07686 [Tolypocladium paradoxum]|uniref:EGF domain-specific O-linked N-acetylglucosamine transferase n=1 Tax=Tolypocladium paradoxum TaxID=94208 RepID=A0A2S4KPL2_9HYPO|nr:Uncharacterized protein TPAR_07686 [Tolypocladium paradoxum]
MLVSAHRRYRASVIVLAVFVALLLLLSRGYTRLGAAFTAVQPTSDPRISPPLTVPDLPDDYYLAGSLETPWCQDRFGTRYLENARNFSVSFCSDESASRLTCFLSSTAPGEPTRVDAMCYGHRAVFDESLYRFRLGCDPRPLTPDEMARGVPIIPDSLPRYWYETGPGVIMDEAVLLDKAASVGRSQITTILLKREGMSNLWHSLMEIMSLSWSLDVLQMTVDAHTGEPFIPPKAGPTTQVIVVDKHEDGPFIDLWKLFAKMPIRRIHELNASEPVSDIIIPFAGGSNTLWQGDWEDLLCRDSSLVKTFVPRALALYNVATPVGDDDEVIVTYIRRTNTRKLLDEDAHMQALRKEIPHMKLNVVDFATVPFAEQLKTVRRTDLLVGVHGAGLTHLMFLQPGSAVLEILPDGFQHKGFRNLAQMLGIGYFRAHTKMHGDASGNDQWQFDAVEIDQQRLVDLVSYGVKSLYNNGKKSYDIL